MLISQLGERRTLWGDREQAMHYSIDLCSEGFAASEVSDQSIPGYLS